ncbi:MAG: RluA family pseudouridine synthase, partial [Myxococcota bacterium]
RPGTKVGAGARVSIEVPATAPATAVAQDLPLVVVYEDEDVAVIDKAAGMVVHPAPGHADGTLVNALLHHLEGLSSIGGQERPGLVHRLDRGTSGLLVVAKNDRSHRSLAGQFAAHTAGRVYLAWVHDPPAPDAGTERSELGRHPRDRVRFAVVPEGEGRVAVTHWRVVARRGTVGLLRVTLETGRTHQVRVHLSALGSPLLGDPTYGRGGASAVPASLRSGVDPSGDRPLLHAWQLGFDHPTTGERRRFVAPPPADFGWVAEQLGLQLPEPEP